LNKSHKLFFISIALLLLVGVVSMNTKFPSLNQRVSFSPDNVEAQKEDGKEYYQKSLGKTNWGLGLSIFGIIILISLAILLLKTLRK